MNSGLLEQSTYWADVSCVGLFLLFLCTDTRDPLLPCAQVPCAVSAPFSFFHFRQSSISPQAPAFWHYWQFFHSLLRLHTLFTWLVLNVRDRWTTPCAVLWIYIFRFTFSYLFFFFFIFCFLCRCLNLHVKTEKWKRQSRTHHVLMYLLIYVMYFCLMP